MTGSATDLHRHDRIRLRADYVDPAGRPVDHHLLARILGAMMDGCGLCEELLLVMLAEDATTTARLVELCCLNSVEHGGFAPHTTGPACGRGGSTHLRELVEVGITQGSAAMAQRCEQMTSTQRHALGAGAMAMLIHNLSTE